MREIGFVDQRVDYVMATETGVTTRRSGRLAAVLTVMTLCVLAAPGVASADPGNPSDGQISAAQQAANAAAAQVGQITTELATAQTQVGHAEAAANIALGAFETKQADYHSAQTAALQAQAAAHQSQAARAEAEAAVATFARNSYMQGSTSPGFQAALTSDGPQQMLERNVLLAAANSHRTDVLAQMTTAQQQATAADDAATAALAKAATLQQQAQSDLNSATTLENQARQESGALQAQQAQLQAQLQTAQQTLVGLQGARAAALTYQQQQAAALAAQTASYSRPSASTPAPVVTTSSRGNTSAAQTAMNAALRYVGQMYAWGGGSLTGPSEGFGPDVGVIGFDCSGLTRYAYAQAGVHLPRVAADQYAAFPTVASPQPGDLVFYASDPSDPSTIHHVAMYLGNGQMIEAPESGERIHVTAMRYGYEYIGAVRPSA
jgi:cell wall-associated NlpC family hydrolase